MRLSSLYRLGGLLALALVVALLLPRTGQVDPRALIGAIYRSLLTFFRALTAS